MARQLESQLKPFQRRILALQTGASVGWGLASLLGLMLVWMWLDLAVDLAAWMRVVLDILAVLAAIALIVRGTIEALRLREPSHLARRLDATSATGGQVLTGVDLMRDYGSAQPPPGQPQLTHGLALMAQGRAVSVLSKLRPQSAIPANMLVRPLGGLLLLCLGAAILFLIAPRLSRTQWSRFLDPHGDHPPFSRITFQVDPGDAKVVYGNPLEIHVTANGAEGQHLELLVQQQGSAVPERLPMFPIAAGKWQATLSSVTANAHYCVRAGGSRSSQYTIDVITVPQLGDVRFVITPPLYAHHAPVYRGPVPQNGISGLAGTTVQMWAKSNRPLSSGTVLFTPSAGDAASSDAPPPPVDATPSNIKLSPSRDDPSEVTGTFTLAQNGKIDLTVRDTAAQDSTDHLFTNVTLLSDHRPFVRILEPLANSFASPEATISVRIVAEDDYGITTLQLMRSLNDSRISAENLPVPAGEPTRLYGSSQIKLSDFGLDSGDYVKLFSRVEDNDPAGHKGSESSVVIIHVVSKEELERMMLAKEGLDVLEAKYEEARRRMEADMDRLEKLEKELEKAGDTPLTKEQLDKLRQIEAAIRDDANAVAKEAKHDLPFDIDKKLHDKLDKIAQDLNQTADAADELSKRSGLGAARLAQELKGLHDDLNKDEQPFQQQAVDPLEYLAKIFPLIEDQRRFVDLYQHQRDLAQRLVSLQQVQNPDDPKIKARMRDLQAEQRQIRDDLNTLAGDISNHLAQLPEDPKLDDLRRSTQDWLDALKNSEATADMQDAQAALEEFRGGPAQTAAQLAADDMEKLIAKVKMVGGQAEDAVKFQPQLVDEIGDTVQQLLDAEGLGDSVGEGNANGTGGGSSYRRHTLRNVGIYGATARQRGLASGGARGNSADGGAGMRGDADNPDAAGATAETTMSRAHASGQADAAVPPQYQRRVGDYFQRVNDELGEK